MIFARITDLAFVVLDTLRDHPDLSLKALGLDSAKLSARLFSIELHHRQQCDENAIGRLGKVLAFTTSLEAR